MIKVISSFHERNSENYGRVTQKSGLSPDLFSRTQCLYYSICGLLNVAKTIVDIQVFLVPDHFRDITNMNKNNGELQPGSPSPRLNAWMALLRCSLWIQRVCWNRNPTVICILGMAHFYVSLDNSICFTCCSWSSRRAG
jgi:hypothetical protein